MKKYIFSIALSFTSLESIAGTIEDTFGDGLFEVKWGMSLKEVKNAHPLGKTKEYGNISQYTVEHEKPVLKVKREGTHLIFSFNPENQLNGVMVEFEGNQYGDVMSAATSYFGPYQNTPNNTATRIDWPTDAGLKFYLLGMPVGFYIKSILVIENTNRLGASPEKEEIGF